MQKQTINQNTLQSKLHQTTSIKSKSQKQLLIEMIAVSGEYPAESIHRLVPAASYSKKLLTMLSSDKLIKIIYRGGLRGYRLTSRGKRRLLDENYDRFKDLLSGDAETNKMRSDHLRRLRLHSGAQVYTIMNNVGAHIFQDLNPNIFYDEQLSISDAPSQSINKSSENNTLCKSDTYFYSSREQKCDDVKSNSIRGSRAAGTLMTPTRAYAVYNTGNTRLNWWEKTEQRYKSEVLNNFRQMISCNQQAIYEVNGIMIGENMDVFMQYWEILGSERNGKKQIRIFCAILFLLSTM